MPYFITELRKVSSGAYRISVEKENYSRKFPMRLTSITRYTYTTTCMPDVDDFHSDDERRSARGERNLIRQCRWWGEKEMVKY